MKKLLLLATSFAFLVNNIFAQGIPAPTTIQKKKVLLELYSGINCQFCPRGDKSAEDLVDAHPGKVIIFDIQTGGYAVPGSGQPDYRTPFGNGLQNPIDLTGYPAGVVNRHVFPGWGQSPSGLAMSDSRFASAANQILAEDAAANIGIEAEIDVQSRLLTVQVQIYYTGNPSTTTNKLSVAILQDNIVGPQIIASNVTPHPDLILPNGLYVHSNMLRHMITSTFGQNVSPGIAGTTIDKTYSYQISDSIYEVPAVLGDLKIVAFLTETTKEVICAEVVKPVFTNFQHTLDSRVVETGVTEDPICGGYNSTPFVRFLNNGSQTLNTLAIDYTINGSIHKTQQWTGTVSPMSELQINLDPINYYPLETNTLTVTVSYPNGGSDQNSSDNELSYEFYPAPDASNAVTMVLQLDYYGSEVSWKIVNSAQTVLYSGGPYSNVAIPDPNNPPPLPAPITQNFNIPSGDCYKLAITDSYGDGILGTNTGFTLTDDEGFEIVSDYADYDSVGSVSFGVDAPKVDSTDVFTGISSVNTLEKISVYPNPASGIINVNLPSAISNLSIDLSNFLGQTIMTIAENEKQPNGNIQINTTGLAPGVYFLKFVSGENRYAQKIVIAN